nr:hypothetical protein [Frankia tisae]
MSSRQYGSSTIPTSSSPVRPATHYDLRRIPLYDPTPVYPHSLIWHRDNSHPALATLHHHLASIRSRRRDTGIWTPAWATRQV